MRVISNQALIEFARIHPDAAMPLQAWRKIIERNRFEHFAALRKTFNAVDRVGGYYVFDIAGNRYRLITAIHFNRKMLFIRKALTHDDYKYWRP